MFDFAGEMTEGIYGSDCTLITVSGKSGVRVGTQKAYDCAVALGKPRMFVVTKLDDDNANFYNVLTDLKSKFGSTVCPVVVPVIADRKIISYVNLIEMKAYCYDEAGKAVETEMPTAAVSEKMGYRMDGLIEAFSEAVAETDEALFEKFFSGEPFTQKERIDGIHNGFKNGIITPVTCVSAATLAGVDMLMKELELLVPSAPKQALALDAAGEPVEISCTPDAPTKAVIFKTAVDPFVGKLSFLKVLSGSLKSGVELVNATDGSTEKIGKLLELCGKKQTEKAEAVCGDLIAVAKLRAHTNDTLCASEQVVSMEAPEYPLPCYRMAVQPAARGDEAKVASAMQKILEEDQTLSYEQDPTTKEAILSGLGEQHLAAVVSRLQSDFGVSVT